MTNPTDSIIEKLALYEDNLSLQDAGRILSAVSDAMVGGTKFNFAELDELAAKLYNFKVAK